ncbi:sensor histidine kinase [Chitinophaga filiformis]|uniref:sensor histidine kinase n=1 Tax=Chitinophaga filiformis TaxID=104663 RepID=UPI001F48A3BF|nr:sensor histidine kinase [Chitinophaga filiformis]MCF6405207.1 sensor histidine kinase [Chitinophaga filiformis]
MSGKNFTCLLFWLLIPSKVASQLPAKMAIPGYSYHPMREDKASWQRLSMYMGGTFLVVTKEGQVDLDSCIAAAGRSMQLSRLSILAENIDDPQLSGESGWIDRREPEAGIRRLSETTGRKRLQLLILLGAYYAFETDSYHRHLDSVTYFLTKAINESNSLNEARLGRLATCLLAKVYVQANDEKGDSISDALINKCRQAGDKQIEARMLAYRGIYKPAMATTLEKKITDLQQAAPLYHSLGYIEAEINALTDLGYLLFIAGQVDHSYETLLKAFKLAEAIHYPYTHYNTQAIASITGFQGKFGEPLRYVYQTINTALITRDSFALSYFYTDLSALLNSEGRIKESAEIARKSVDHFVAQRNGSVYNILGTVVNYMAQEGRAKEALDLTVDVANKVGFPVNPTEQFFYHYVFSNCYLHLNMPDQAEMHIKKLDSLETAAATIRGPLRKSIISTQYGYLFLTRKQYQKARELFEEEISNPTRASATLSNAIAAYNRLIYIDSILGDNTAAAKHYRKYVQLLDSSFRVTKIRQAEELQITYQINEKENEITSLIQQAKLEKTNSEKAALVRNLMALGVMAVIIIAGLLFRQNRLKQRNSRLITEKNRQLQQLLTDKEWLLREVHHRVKNNLQIVISLLDSQSEYINNDAALAAIEDNMRRVHAMALIHQKLYQSEDITTIAMPEYIRELVDYARDSFDTGTRIRFEQNIASLELDISQAIPLGLIINEAIVNAIKYAFPGRQYGTVNIHLYQDGPDQLILKISDNGIGLPAGTDTKAHASLGFDLMQGLATQLNGRFSFANDNGLHITIRFVVMNMHLSRPFLTNS